LGNPADRPAGSRIVESCVRALEAGDFERRLRDIERQVEEAGAPGA